jgi:hypothetical protein
MTKNTMQKKNKKKSNKGKKKPKKCAKQSGV